MATPEENDRRTLQYIACNPGCKRSSTWVTKAAVARLIRNGLVEPPSTNGKLFVTDKGRSAVANG